MSEMSFIEQAMEDAMEVIGQLRDENVALLNAAQFAYLILADIHNEWPGRNTLHGQRVLCLLRDAIALAVGIDPQEVQDAASVSEQP